MEVAPCISGIQYFWVKLCDLFAPNLILDRDLPYDIIADIFSRLPAESVYLCGQSCSPLRSLTRTPSFVAVHLSRVTPVVAFQHYSTYQGLQKCVEEFNVRFTDDVAKAIHSKTIKFESPLTWEKKTFVLLLHGSYNGFLIFKNLKFDSVLYLLNPNTQEQVCVVAPYLGYNPRGFFFHPTTNEYRVLFVRKRSGYFEFVILNLRTKSSRLVTRHTHPPSNNRPPAIVNGILHWMTSERDFLWAHRSFPGCEDSIVMFNTISEEVSTMGHPEIRCHGTSHIGVKLMEKEGKLWLCDDWTCGRIVIWILEDYENRHWVKVYDLSFRPFNRVCGFTNLNCREHNISMEVVAIYKEELLLQAAQKELYLCAPRVGNSYTMTPLGEKLPESVTVGAIKDGKKQPILVAAVTHFDTIVSLQSDNAVFLHEEQIVK